MQKELIFDKVMKIIRDDLELSHDVTVNTALLRDGVMDSMDWLGFLTRLEEVFAIKIPYAEAADRQIGIVSNLLAYLEEKTG